LPFKNSVFYAVVSYHYFDLISSDMLCYAFDEAARVLAKDSSLFFMILQWTAQNDAQKSSLLFNELLKSTGTLFRHELEDVSRQLSASGFREITVEIIKRKSMGGNGNQVACKAIFSSCKRAWRSYAARSQFHS
jgi:hypothetical protein